jgi:hypothetical protein
MTTETRAPRVDVATASSTSWEASCAPTSTPSVSHSTSPSTSCWVPVAGPAGHPSSATPNWSVWPSPKCCSGSAPSGAGCASPVNGWATCSRICQRPRPTTAAFVGPRRWSPWPSRTSPPTPRAGATNSAWSTRPRCRVPPRGRPSSARRWPAMPAMATARVTTATSGASGSMCWPPVMGCRWPGVWPPQAGRA